ncbi:fasciclin domain-containing protein [Croceivirga thetidis]|uniref:Fasciclin domain-containing protein n=1 Tax=Croceivirga thetidis TaxID=2721623 RepID=A0ABX1GPX1_9FLAO|nr:fasciclin domain-containing protein [Croceivirga thetidis]NKI31120.1 fasciclin domain-containing protein [Croceivirga thetidis]
MKTINTIKSIALVAALAATSISFAQEEDMRKAKLQGEKMMEKAVMVGGAEMLPTKNIIENAVNSEDHTTLVAAVKAAGLVETLSGEGPFTVFAPTNAAFEKLPEGTVETLLKETNKNQLIAVLTYHVLPGKFEAKDVIEAIKEGKGKAVLTTVNGGTLTAMLDGKSVKIQDENGNVATVTQANVFQSNGVIHVTDTVSLPSAEEAEEMEDNK